MNTKVKRLKPPPTRVRTQKLKATEPDYKGRLSTLYEVDHGDGETYIDVHTDKVYTADKKYHGKVEDQAYNYDSMLHEPRKVRTHLKKVLDSLK